MLWLVFAFLVVVIGILATLSDEPIDESERYIDVNDFIKKEDMIADLETLAAIFEKIHPNPYRFQKKHQFKSFLEQRTRELPDSLNTLNFWRLIDETICRFNDAHSYAKDFYVLNDYVQKKKLFFPLAANIEKDRIIVTSNHTSDSTILKGMEIVSINGINSKYLVQKLTTHSVKETYTLDLKEISEDFGFYLWKTYDWGSTFKIKYKNDKKGFSIDSLLIEGIPWEQRSKKVSSQDGSFKFEILEDETGIIKIIDFDNGSRSDYNNFYEESFKKLKEKKIKNLIIDFRNHTGGADQYGEDLAKYIAKKPFRKLHEAFWKITPEFKEAFDRRFVPKGIRWFKPIYLINEYSKVFYGKEPTDLVIVRPEFKQPLPEKERFEGRVFLITNHNTFSAGSVFAEMFKYYDMGTIIGQPTGNLCSFNGFALSEHVLPNSKITFQVSSVYNIANSGEEGLKTVVPDRILETHVDPIDYISNQLITEFN